MKQIGMVVGLAGVLVLAEGTPPVWGAAVCGGKVGPNETVTMTADILNCAADPVLTVIGPATPDMNRHTISCPGPTPVPTNDGLLSSQ
jgi:hypothetical protein